MRLLDISHEHKFPGEYEYVAHVMLTRIFTINFILSMHNSPAKCVFSATKSLTNPGGFCFSYSLQERNGHGAAWEGPGSVLDSAGEVYPRLPSGVCLQWRHYRGRKGRDRTQEQLVSLHLVAMIELCSLCFTVFQKYSMKFDKSTGIIEMFMDSLEVTDEGTFTFNLVDGKAKGTTSLVLIGDGKL